SSDSFRQICPGKIADAAGVNFLLLPKQGTTTMSKYDVIIIGSGPGGYVCAIRCAQLGLKTACVEGRETLGGTCLNVGCIPSKALLHASQMLRESETTFAAMGLEGAAPAVNWEKMLAYKDSTISANTKGIEFL